jgi:hypothetical protein
MRTACRFSHAELDVAAGRSHGAGRHQDRPGRLSPSGPPRGGRRGARPGKTAAACPGFEREVGSWRTRKRMKAQRSLVKHADKPAYTAACSSTGIWKLPPASRPPVSALFFQRGPAKGVRRQEPAPTSGPRRYIKLCMGEAESQISAGKRFSEARDWVAIFGEDCRFHATETGISRTTLAKAPGR